MRQTLVGSLFPCILVVSLFGCAAPPPDAATPAQFFENSVRRDATDDEKDVTAKVGGCTAFFVENTAGKTLVVSARHCFNYSITTWCDGGGIVRTNDGQEGRCTRIVASDRTHDIALFEADLPAPARTLQLAAYAPATGTRLVMVGYPADQDPQNPRRGRLTTTESCWILHPSVASPHGGSLGIHDRSSLHNCSTYGGNSGGPMMRAGTREAVGLPFTYQPGDYTRRSANGLDTAAHMAQMADFVGAQRTALAAAGVTIIASPRF